MANNGPGDGLDRPTATAVPDQDDDDATGFDVPNAAPNDLRSTTTRAVGVVAEPSFIRDCIRMGLGTLSGYVCFAYGDVEEFANDDKRANCEIVIMACLGVDGEALAMALARLRDFEPTLPVLVLGPPKVEYISIAIAHGAKGYIPFTTRFEVMVEVIRVILAGGTYAPLDCLAAAGPAAGRDAQADGVRIASSPAALTARELSVVRAIQQGKSNKVIAYNLNMTESTVKVHVRHIMTKLKAKNRTEIAVMSDKIGLELCDELPLN